MTDLVHIIFLKKVHDSLVQFLMERIKQLYNKIKYTNEVPQIDCILQLALDFFTYSPMSTTPPCLGTKEMLMFLFRLEIKF